MKRKILSLALAAIFILALAACGDAPASDFEYQYDAEAGGVVITKYIGTSMTVRIPSKIEGEPVVGIGRLAFTMSGIMEVYIPNSVTIIGDGAFYICTGLTSITIPNSVTWIGSHTFSGIPDLRVTHKGKTYTDMNELYNAVNGG